MDTFGFLWNLLLSHGVVPGKMDECARLWGTYTIEEQRQIYCSIRDKIRAGKFVHYNPVRALQENAPQKKQQQQLSFNAYYERFGTTEEQDGWKRVYLPEEQKTIYTKN